MRAIKVKKIKGTRINYCDKRGNIYTLKDGALHLRVPVMTVRGRVIVSLAPDKNSKKPVGKVKQVSRIIAETWVHNPKPHEYNVVMHKDDNVWNNRADNLQWGTQKQNLEPVHERYRKTGNKGNRHRLCPTIIDNIELIVKLRKEGYSIRYINKLIGLKPNNKKAINNAIECYKKGVKGV